MLTTSAGSNTLPIYFTGGKPAAITNIEISSTNTSDKYVKTTNSNGSVGVYASTNRGLYDFTKSDWIVYNNTAGNHTYIPLWKSKGSATLPVYFNASGEPVACNTSLAVSISGNAATATALTSNAGSSTLPIYFSGGKPVACSTTLGVSITGNATTATSANALASTGYGNDNFTWYQTSGEFAGNSGWASYLISNHGDGSNYYHQIIAIPFWDAPKYRRMEGSTSNIKGWYDFITDENYTTKLDARYYTEAEADGRFVNVTGDSMSGTLSWGGNVSSLNFRTGHASYDGVISYQTSGNEAMLFTTKNAVTSFMFVNGEDTITNMASDRWTKITPGLQIKNNCVAIGKLIGNEVTPAYKLDVNGTARFSDVIYMDNGMQWKAPGNITCNKNDSHVEFSFDMGAGTQWHVWSAPNGTSMLSCFADTKYVQVHHHLQVGNYNNSSYALTADSFICNSWIRTTGNTGWYNENYGGGWYMTDGNYVRSYNSKPVFVGNTVYIGTSSGAGTGLSLYNTSAPNSYGIHMSYTSTYGKHGFVQGDWATYFCFDGSTNRGWIFKQAGNNVASINGTGKARFDDTVFGYAYTRSNSKAAFMWDKNGANYTGVGSINTDDTIYFGACDSEANWITNYQQKWRFNGEIQALGPNAFRMVQGSYGSFLRNDGSNTYFLITAANDQYGSWNNLRPICFNNASGDVTMGHNLTVGGNGNFGGHLIANGAFRIYEMNAQGVGTSFPSSPSKGQIFFKLI